MFLKDSLIHYTCTVLYTADFSSLYFKQIQCMDIIFLKEFRVKTLIGIYPWEKKIPQTIELNIEIALPSQQASQTDHIEDALDYSKVVDKINSMLAQQHFSLLETLTEHIAQMILNEFGSPWVKISAAKLDVIPGVKQLGICIERSQSHH